MVPAPPDIRRTTEAAEADPLLRRFLDDYWSEGSYYDWGDDPSFFCTQAKLRDLTRTSWGVCRPDVRRSAQIGDAVAFFCAKPDFEQRGSRIIATGPSDYFFIGCGTIAELVDRRNLWRMPEYDAYRAFYNVLAKPDGQGRLRQHETIHRYHPDWAHRADAPYVLFDHKRTAFNIETPPRVSRYEPAYGVPDRWLRDPVSRRIQRLLFADRPDRRLRTSDKMRQHAKMTIRRSPDELQGLVDELVAIATSS